MAASGKELLELFEALLSKSGVDNATSININYGQLAREVLDGELFLNNPPKIGIIGKVNVGKSTLGNAMFGEEVFSHGIKTNLTKEVRERRIPPGILIYDTPGFGARATQLEQMSRNFMRTCDLLLYVVMSPQNIDEFAQQLYEREVVPLNKPVITVINVDETKVPIQETKSAFDDAVEILQLPNMIPVRGQSGYGVGDLLLKMVENLPPRFLNVFRNAINERYRQKTNIFISYKLAVEAAAIAACTRVSEEYSNSEVKARANTHMLLSIGLSLKIASLCQSNFDPSGYIKLITKAIQMGRYDEYLKNSSEFAKIFGTIVGGGVGALAPQIPVIAAAVGLAPLGPFGIAAVVILTSALGGFAGGVLKKNDYKLVKMPKRGGFDTAIAVLSTGYATLATILAQSAGKINAADSLDYFEKVWVQCNDVTIREVFDDLDKDRDKIEKATEGDRVLVSRLIDQDKLRQIFLEVIAVDKGP